MAYYTHGHVPVQQAVEDLIKFAKEKNIPGSEYLPLQVHGAIALQQAAEALRTMFAANGVTGLPSTVPGPMAVAECVRRMADFVMSTYTLPTDFASRFAISANIYEVGRTYVTDYNFDALIPNSAEVYVSKTGNDTTGTGSFSNPYRSVAKAYAMGASVIAIGAGVWDKSDAFAAGSLNTDRHLALISYDGPGKAIMTRQHTGLTWAQQSSPNTNVYLATIPTANSVTAVVDRSNLWTGEYLKDGITLVPKMLSLQTSIANCQANPGSFYVTGTSLYVCTFDGRAPDSNILTLTTDSFIWFTTATDKKVIFDGLEVWGAGGIRTEHAGANTSLIAARNSGFRYSNYSTSLVQVQGTKQAIFFDCEATDHRSADGFSYKSTSLLAPVSALEYNCVSHRHGNNGGANNYNAFTSHNNSTVVRLNGLGRDTYGPGFGDVLGAISVNLGCTYNDSLATVANGQKAAFNIGTVSDLDGTTSKMWTRNCTAGGSNYARVQATGGEFTDLGGFVDNTTLHDSGVITQL